MARKAIYGWALVRNGWFGLRRRASSNAWPVPGQSPLNSLTQPSAALALVEGPVVPEWGGVGNPGDGCYAGLPGQGYAKDLEELWTGTSPLGAYWNRTRVVQDTMNHQKSVLRSWLVAALLCAPPIGTTQPSESPSWVPTGGPPGGLGYDIRYNFDPAG